MKKLTIAIISAFAALAMGACTTSNTANCPATGGSCPMANTASCPCTQKGICACPQKATCPKKCPSMKLTKEMFYQNGKFNEEAAKEAYFDMMKNLGYPISENLRKNMWVCDFGVGDFPNVGMAGIFWIHDNKYGIFGHEIFLLPNQLLVEHAHVANAGLPAKYEAWQCRAGRSYCFGEEGEDASKYPDVKVPESQKKYVTVHKVQVADAAKGDIVRLNRQTAFHYQIAGPQGAVVTEYGVYHQNDGNRYTYPDVKF